MQLLHHFPMSIMSNVSHITHQNVQNIQNVYLFGKYWDCTLHMIDYESIFCCKQSVVQ